MKRRLFSFLGVCSNLKLLVPLVVIALMPFAFLGPAYLEATEVAAQESSILPESSVLSETAVLLKTLAANDKAVKAGDLAGLEPSRLLLLILGVIMVGIAYQRSWRQFRDSR